MSRCFAAGEVGIVAFVGFGGCGHDRFLLILFLGSVREIRENLIKTYWAYRAYWAYKNYIGPISLIGLIGKREIRE